MTTIMGVAVNIKSMVPLNRYLRSYLPLDYDPLNYNAVYCCIPHTN